MLKDVIYSVTVSVVSFAVITAAIKYGPGICERVVRKFEGPLFKEGDTVGTRPSRANPWRKQ